MWNFRVLVLLAVIGSISCVEIKWGKETEGKPFLCYKLLISFPLAVGGKQYYFALTDSNNGRDWYIQELKEDGKLGQKTSTGTFKNACETIFPYANQGKQFIFRITGDNRWSVQEVLPGGLLSELTKEGLWGITPTIAFPFDVGGKQYMYCSKEKNWYIKELLPNGAMSSGAVDKGTWTGEYYLAFPFSINGKQYFYSVSHNHWFIRELLPGGKMGLEADYGNEPKNHKVAVPFSIDGKYYYYAMSSETDWFIRELLPAGKMGQEKLHGSWDFFCPFCKYFAFYIKGRQFLFGFSKYYYFIKEIIQEPRMPIVTNIHEEYCINKNNTNGVINKGLNAIEERINNIEMDKENYELIVSENEDHPILTISTLRVAADEIHPRSIKLTVAMHAKIRHNHISVKDHTISCDVYNHLREMDREMDDDANPLLPFTLGGPNKSYNFIPASPSLSSAVNVSGSAAPQPGWFQVEEMLRDYLINTRDNSYIRWNLLVEYGLLPNSRRPTALLLSVRLYDAVNNLAAIHSYRFLNVPSIACTNSNHDWWNHSL